MFVSFRQGIIKGLTLAISDSYASAVDLIVRPGYPTLITFAHYEANYLVSENSTVFGAWGSGSNPNNGSLPTTQPVYLYWDINLGTGALSRGWTTLAPIYSSGAPTSPSNGQMWFDTVNTVWSVWVANPGVWQNVIRCFSGTYTNGSAVTLQPLGSQVQPPITGSFSTGNILLGTNLTPLRNNDGTLVTTAQSLTVSQTNGQNVSFDATLVWGEASVSIPAFSFVAFQSGKYISPVLNNTSIIGGIVTSSLTTSSVGQVISNGVIINESWTWNSADVSAPVFCDTSGAPTLTPPTSGILQQVGTVYDTDAILINIAPPVRIVGTTGANGTAPSIGAPLVIGKDGLIEGLPTNGILNIDGVMGPNFTVGGKGLLFNDGTATTGGTPAGLCFGYVYTQSSAASSWTINHNKNTTNIMSVTVYDTSNIRIYPDTITITNANTVVITFADTQAGSAALTYFV